MADAARKPGAAPPGSASSARRLDSRHLNAVRIEVPAVPEHAPGDTGELVGERGCQLVLVHALRSLLQPGAEAEVLPIVGPHDDDSRARTRSQAPSRNRRPTGRARHRRRFRTRKALSATPTAVSTTLALELQPAVKLNAWCPSRTANGRTRLCRSVRNGFAAFPLRTATSNFAIRSCISTKARFWFPQCPATGLRQTTRGPLHG